MSSMFWLALAGVAHGQECEKALEPEAVAARLDAVKEGVLFGEPAAQQELSAIEDSLVCLNGPLDQAELGELMLAQAAYATFMGSDGSVYYQRAARLGATDPDYGVDVAAKVQAAVQPDPALLVLDFEPVPAVMFVDGVITYSTGPRELSSGWHIVQWLGDEGWEVRVLDLAPGGEEVISVRTAPPPTATTEPGSSASSEDTVPRAPREGLVQASVAVGYQIARASLGQDGQVYDGLQGTPSAVIRARTLGTWHLRVGAELGPFASGARTGSPARGHVAAGWQQREGLELSAAAGLLIAGASVLNAGAPGQDPSFDSGRAFGAALVLSARPIEPVYLELQGQWLPGGVGGGVLVQGQVWQAGSVPLLLSVGANHWRGQDTRLSWAQLGLGTSLSF